MKHGGGCSPLWLRGRLSSIHRRPHHAWIVPRLVSDHRDVLVALLARTVQNHVGLTFNPLDRDPDSKEVLLVASGTVLLHCAQSVRLHRDCGNTNRCVRNETEEDWRRMGTEDWGVRLVKLKLVFTQQRSWARATPGQSDRQLLTQLHSADVEDRINRHWQEPDIAVQWKQLLLCAHDSVLLYSQSWANGMTTTTERPRSLRCRHPLHGATLEEDDCQQVCYCEAETQEHKRCCAADKTVSSSECHPESAHFNW